MTILQLISSEGYYGAESMLVALSTALSRLGCECIVGVFADRRAPHTEVAAEARRCGLAVELLPCRGRFDWGTVRKIRRIIARDSVHVVHTHGYKADLYGLMAAWPGKPRLVATCHNWPDARAVMRFYAALDRLALRRFDHVAAVGERVAAILRSASIRAVTEVRNGIDCRPFADVRPAPREATSACGPVVGFVGRLVAGKGGAVLLEAAVKVIAAHPDARFVLVGDGPALGDWAALAVRLGIAGSVSFAGIRRDMPEVYTSLDMLVLPSLEEAMPMCVLEASASALPVVATRVGAVPDVVLDEETGLLVDPGDAAGLARAIVRLIEHPALAQRLGRQGRKHVAWHFSADRMAREYLAIYRRPSDGRRKTAALSPGRI